MKSVIKKPAFWFSLLACALFIGHSQQSLTLKAQNKLHLDPNPFAIFGSPYGKPIASAMQGPIHLLWHDGEKHHHHDEEGHHDHHESHHTDDHASHHSDHHEHAAHHHDDHHDHGHGDHHEEAPTSLTAWIHHLNEIPYERTNPYSHNEIHQSYLRGIIEEKVHFAWRMDPTNFDNYNIYHLFLTEQAVAKSNRNYRKAFEVAQDTIKHCQQHPDDVQANLTAAAASQAIVDIALNFKRDQIETQILANAHRSAATHLKRHAFQLEAAKQYGILSSSEHLEMSNTARILSKVQEANQVALTRWNQQ